MNKVFVHHILPLEYYPPVTNLLNLLDEDKNIKTVVYSTHNNKNRKDFQLNRSKIFRSTYPAFAKHFLQKLLRYVSMVLGPLFRLLWFKPDSVIYYEPHSAYPIYLYKRFFNKKIRVFIHYHEYYSPQDFTGEGMSLIKFFHKKEVDYLYPRAHWISQTNTDRLSYFASDFPFISSDVLHTLANYPPRAWHTDRKINKHLEKKIRFLYIGALSFENTYIKEFIDFIEQNPNKTLFEMYSYNLHDDVRSYLNDLEAHNIKFVDGGIPYNEIPEIARNFDVGLVLYKGHNINYQYNAPNKLFEYMATGLNVWVPKELLGCSPYLNETSRPYISSVNYDQLDSSFLKLHLKRRDLPYKKASFNCEDELTPLLKTIMED